MNNLPTGIIQLIFNPEIWPNLRLVNKRFLKISKTDAVMRYIDPEHAGERDIYQKMVARSKVHYVVYYKISENYPKGNIILKQVQTFYGTVNLQEVDMGCKKLIAENKILSPIKICGSKSEKEFRKSAREYMKKYSAHMGYLRYGWADRFLKIPSITWAFVGIAFYVGTLVMLSRKK